MLAVVQRVTRASVRVIEESASRTTGEIGQGLVVLLGVGHEDSESDAEWMARKCAELRIFRDDDGKMNRSVLDVGGAVLAVSQFTLFGDCAKGRRPSFIGAAPPEKADPLYQRFVSELRGRGLEVGTGVFQATMEVDLVNDGPVTLLLDSAEQRKRKGEA
ncbi:MAG: D-aminoacyl-tRNA deacylase [Candidatus Eisenbacteria bacterium]